MTGSYRELKVWQESMKLAAAVYRTTEKFPKHELYGLTNQVRRAAVSIPSNIAEGKGHRTDREFRTFLFHARGSLLEMETQISLACELKYLGAEEADILLRQAGELGRMLNGLINALGDDQATSAVPGR